WKYWNYAEAGAGSGAGSVIGGGSPARTISGSPSYPGPNPAIISGDVHGLSLSVHDTGKAIAAMQLLAVIPALFKADMDFHVAVAEIDGHQAVHPVQPPPVQQDTPGQVIEPIIVEIVFPPPELRQIAAQLQEGAHQPQDALARVIIKILPGYRPQHPDPAFA